MAQVSVPGNKLSNMQKMIRLRFFMHLILAVFLMFSRLHGRENPSDENFSVNSPEGLVSARSAKDKPSEEANGPKSKVEKESEAEKPPSIGNFSLATSQQPAALFGFGGNIIDKGEVQTYYFVDYFKGNKRVVTDIIPGGLFGVNDDWSLFFNFPLAPLMQDGYQKSRGLEDFFVQLEYAFYNKQTWTYTDEATIVVNTTLPIGSCKKNPPTGFGAPSFFVGATYYRTWVEWIAFTALGSILTTAEHRTKFGDQFLYQFGFGRNIPSPPERIYAWILEVDGQYSRKNRINGCLDRDSGGNYIFVTPSPLGFDEKLFTTIWGKHSR